MAREDVFADTSALYAFVNKRDAYHAEARRIVERLLHARRQLIASDYVVAETVNLANARGGYLLARRVLDLMDQTEGLRIEWIGVARFELAKAFFRKHADHRYSFTDCTSFVVMRELRVSEVLTSDHHFAEVGFRPLLSAA